MTRRQRNDERKEITRDGYRNGKRDERRDGTENGKTDGERQDIVPIFRRKMGTVAAPGRDANTFDENPLKTMSERI